MDKGRIEAFSDGVIAILITIMVLGLAAPRQADLAALRPLIPTFLSYILSFVFLGIYWNNHHHLLQAVERVDGRVLWANLHLLFWLSLIPFATAWLGENEFARIPAAAYGIVLLAAALAYFALQTAIIRDQGPDSVVAHAVGRDIKGRLSPAAYALGIGLSFVSQWLAMAVYAGMAVVWLVPDRRIERTVRASPSADLTAAAEDG